MPAYKMGRHFNEVKRCPTCRRDSMKFNDGMNTWICSTSYCLDTAREDFFQVPLPSSRELETDQIQPDQSDQQREPIYLKSIKAESDEDNDYEYSVNRGEFGEDTKYSGSAKSALLQDTIKFNSELRRNARIARQQRSQYSSISQEQDSQESELSRHQARKIKERDDNIDRQTDR